MGFPRGSMVKSLPANAGDTGLIPRSGRSPGGGNGNLLQYSCLKNPMDRGAWRATVHRFTKSQTGLSKQADTTRGRSRNRTRYRNTDNLSQNMYRPHHSTIV